MGVRYDLPPMRRGETWAFTIERQASDGSAINLTGVSGRLDIRVEKDSPATSLLLAGAVDGSAGTVAFTATAAETASLAVGDYWYEAELVDGSVVTTLTFGKVTVGWGFPQ